MIKRKRYTFKGLVQGVGFRPFIFKIAKELNLVGFVKNIGIGVTAEFQGDEKQFIELNEKIHKLKPENAIIESIQIEDIETIENEKEFKIEASSHDQIDTIIPHDMAICSDCINEFFDNKNRHYQNFFISCTNCGPRYTMIKKLPYDRENTTMDKFKFCKECEDEYFSPADRRFNAQSTTCEKCGPRYYGFSFEENNEIKFSRNIEYIDFLSKKILEGKIVALKGIGGFHLIANPYDDNVVERLMTSKKRESKPMALICKDIEDVKEICYVSKYEENLFNSNISPIILFSKKKDIFNNVSDNLNTLGIMRAYTATYYYLLRKTNLKFLIATSANISKVPMIIDQNEALEKLKGISDILIWHDREIYRRCDDSVVSFVNDKNIIIRSGRGYAPTYKRLEKADKIIAFGAQEKNSISIAHKNNIISSQFIGDLDSKENIEYYEKTINDYINLFSFEPEISISDKHPQYYSTQYAKDFAKTYNTKIYYLQHHVAHIYSVMLEKNIEKCIGFAFDGTGYGDDGNIWGSEGFIIDKINYKRVFHIDYYNLIGGEKAIKEPIRLAYYYASKIDPLFTQRYFANSKYSNILEFIIKGANIVDYPLTSSMGRLFDIVGTLLNVGETNKYEAMIPMHLESIAEKSEKGYYETIIKFSHTSILDIMQIIQNIIDDIKNGIDKSIISAKFHNTITKIVVDITKYLKQNYNISTVVLSGGVFQNRFLLERTLNELNNHGFNVYINEVYPINDGGISAGQVYYGYLFKKYSEE